MCERQRHGPPKVGRPTFLPALSLRRAAAELASPLLGNARRVRLRKVQTRRVRPMFGRGASWPPPRVEEKALGAFCSLWTGVARDSRVSAALAVLQWVGSLLIVMLGWPVFVSCALALLVRAAMTRMVCVCREWARDFVRAPAVTAWQVALWWLIISIASWLLLTLSLWLFFWPLALPLAFAVSKFARATKKAAQPPQPSAALAPAPPPQRAQRRDADELQWRAAGL